MEEEKLIILKKYNFKSTKFHVYTYTYLYILGVMLFMSSAIWKVQWHI